MTNLEVREIRPELVGLHQVVWVVEEALKITVKLLLSSPGRREGPPAHQVEGRESQGDRDVEKGGCGRRGGLGGHV